MSLKFYDRESDDISLKTSKRSIGETPESQALGLENLKSKLLGTKDLIPFLDENFLLRFLRVAKFDTNKAYERIRKYYTVKKKYPNLFDRFYPSATPTALETGRLIVLPRRPEDNTAILINKRGLFNPSTMDFEEVFLIDIMALEYLIDNPITQICGLTIIIDFAGYGFQHFLQDTPKRLRVAIEIFQNILPIRYRNIHVINAPAIFSFLYNLSYPFLTKKIRNRIHVHPNGDNWVSLHSSLSPEFLPEDYGGKIPNSDCIDVVQEVITKEDYYKEQQKYGFDEKKT